MQRARYVLFTTCLFVLTASLPAQKKSGDLKALRTRPERTAYVETSRHDDVMDFLRVVASASPLVQLKTMGYSFEGRTLPLVVAGTMKDASPAGVKATGKTRVYVNADIHAGEVEGKEAALELLRSLALGQHKDWLDSMVLLFCPMYNPDGNDRINLTNRGSQHGPIGGMGQRANAQNYDLNRDFTKLDAPETRSLALMMNEYDPHVLIDLHTTDGSIHAYHLTWAPPLHPATAPGIVDLLRNQLLPEVTKTIKAKDGWDFHFYGDISGGRSGFGGGLGNIPGGRGDAPVPASQGERAWVTTEPTPRYSANYWGLRNRLGILSETFAYLTFEERIKTARRFVEEILNWTRDHGEAVRKATAEADRVSVAGKDLALVGKAVKSAEPVEVLVGEVAMERNPYTGQMMRRRLDVRKPEKIFEYIHFEAAESTRVPFAYFVPPNLRNVVDRLQGHGISYTALKEPLALKVEQFRIESTTVAAREYQGHKNRTMTGAWEVAEKTLPAGTLMVSVDQPLGRLLVLLMEPRCEDSLVAWNLMDDVLEREKPQYYPVLRSPDPVPQK
jgi:hypothetical protein